MPTREQTSADWICTRSAKWPVCVIFLFALLGASVNLRLHAGESGDTPIAEAPSAETSAEAATADTATEPAEQSSEETSEATKSAGQGADSEEPASEKTDDQPSQDSNAPESEQKAPEQKEPEQKKTEQKEAEQTETKKEDSPTSEGSKGEAETTDKQATDKQESETDNTPPEPEKSVEEERPMEIDPPPAKPKGPEETKDPPKHGKHNKCIIGATATLIEKQSGLKFRARVDSGAKSCSLHVEKIEIQDASTKENVTERMTENIGKVISFVVKNGDGKTHILKRKIAGYVIIKTSDKKEGKRRYKVPLTFLWKNMEKEVLVTLNNRQHMEYPLLIGRNFLHGDFLVDVELNSND